MVDFECKSKMLNSKSLKLAFQEKPMPTIPQASSLPNLSPPLNSNDISLASSNACAAYDNYLRLPQLRSLWASNDFPSWPNEPIIKPALQALEITFRLLATVVSDPRPYSNKREWGRRIESLATTQVQVIAMLLEDEERSPETRGKAPVTDINDMINRSYSEGSLLPRLATWQKSKDTAKRILSTVECEMTRCTYTLGLGEANFNGKKILRYDAVCRPSELHSLETTPYDHVGNYENRTLHATHQIVECWARASRGLLERVRSIESGKFDEAASDCHALEKIWKVVTEVEDALVMMDPVDFLRLKRLLGIKSCGETAPFCFRSEGVVEMAKGCRDLREKVPEILGVEVDPKGGPGMMEAAMKVYGEKRAERVHVLQAMQAVESAMKRFFFAYKQVVAVLMGSAEANGNGNGCCESLSQIFMEPTYFPSLDAAKTFLGYYWENNEVVIPW
ncbi:nematode resistance protein-like HSPRO2 [Lotus japonicus]|uniref:nematode resistance protein-like HSPRO2 n=1 Tax=Lotus japonicus TaxID=34305 RepID=UPI00258C791D|nr:nematode resistance protein-like HSPRO2 [Lotus japonicus]